MTAPAGFRYAVKIAIRYGDIDMLGHLNNAKYLSYFEQSRVSYFRDLKLWHGGQSEAGLILARVEIDFRAPVLLDDIEASVWTRVVRLGNKSFDVENRLTVERSGQTITAAESKSVVVAYDYATAATIRLPDSWRAAIAAYDGLA